MTPNPTQPETTATSDKPMRCALCNKAYPWTQDYWPSMTYAECFRCWKKSADEQVRVALYYRNQWVPALALGCILGGIIAWMVMR